MMSWLESIFQICQIVLFISVVVFYFRLRSEKTSRKKPSNRVLNEIRAVSREGSKESCPSGDPEINWYASSTITGGPCTSSLSNSSSSGSSSKNNSAKGKDTKGNTSSATKNSSTNNCSSSSSMSCTKSATGTSCTSGRHIIEADDNAPGFVGVCTKIVGYFDPRDITLFGVFGIFALFVIFRDYNLWEKGWEGACKHGRMGEFLYLGERMVTFMYEVLTFVFVIPAIYEVVEYCNGWNTLRYTERWVALEQSKKDTPSEQRVPEELEFAYIGRSEDETGDWPLSLKRISRLHELENTLWGNKLEREVLASMTLDLMEICSELEPHQHRNLQKLYLNRVNGAKVVRDALLDIPCGKVRIERLYERFPILARIQDEWRDLKVESSQTYNRFQNLCDELESDGAQKKPVEEESSRNSCKRDGDSALVKSIPGESTFFSRIMDKYNERKAEVDAAFQVLDSKKEVRDSSPCKATDSPVKSKISANGEAKSSTVLSTATDAIAKAIIAADSNPPKAINAADSRPPAFDSNPPTASSSSSSNVGGPSSSGNGVANGSGSSITNGNQQLSGSSSSPSNSGQPGIQNSNECDEASTNQASTSQPASTIQPPLPTNDKKGAPNKANKKDVNKNPKGEQQSQDTKPDPAKNETNDMKTSDAKEATIAGRNGASIAKDGKDLLNTEGQENKENKVPENKASENDKKNNTTKKSEAKKGKKEVAADNQGNDKLNMTECMAYIKLVGKNILRRNGYRPLEAEKIVYDGKYSHLKNYNLKSGRFFSRDRIEELERA